MTFLLRVASFAIVSLHAATVFIVGIIVERRRKLRHAYIARVVTLHESNPAAHQYNE